MAVPFLATSMGGMGHERAAPRIVAVESLRLSDQPEDEKQGERESDKHDQQDFRNPHRRGIPAGCAR